MSVPRPSLFRLPAYAAIAASLAAAAALALRAGEIGTAIAPALAEAGADLGLVVRRVDVSGRANLPAPELEAMVAPAIGRPLFGAGLEALRGRLLANPWIAEVGIRRRLPDLLEVDLVERRPFALWQHEHALVLVDPSGAVLDREDLARWRHLPLLVGAGAPEAAGELLALVSATPGLAETIEAMVRVGERRWDLRMRDGLLVRLPDPWMDASWGPEEALARFARLMQGYHLKERAVTVVDLRLGDRIAVRLAPGNRSLPSGEEQRT